MALREKRNHVSGEMGMQSMTDIIFILLMFFMMISTLTAPSALPLSLPGKSSKNERMSEKRLPTVDIYADGTYQFNGRDVDTASIRQSIVAELKGFADPSKVNIIVAPSPKAPVEATVPVIDMITAMGANVVLDLNE
jgi:biopolymer transport protein ExbD